MLAQFFEAANIMREDIVLEIGCTTDAFSSNCANRTASDCCRL